MDRWTLPNGLEVVTRDVPGARAISIAWGYHFGLDHDPADRPGLASLLAEVAFTAPAGDTPERTRDEMESLRPAGLEPARDPPPDPVQRDRHDRAVPRRAAPDRRADARRDGDGRGPARARSPRCGRRWRERYFGAPDQMLYWQVREYARGLDQAAIAALAAAKGLDRETPASVQQAIARAYVPANGVLVLAGDLAGLDLRSIVAAEFGALPAGEPPPRAPGRRASTRSRSSWSGPR